MSDIDAFLPLVVRARELVESNLWNSDSEWGGSCNGCGADEPYQFDAPKHEEDCDFMNFIADATAAIGDGEQRSALQRELDEMRAKAKEESEWRCKRDEEIRELKGELYRVRQQLDFVVRVRP